MQKTLVVIIASLISVVAVTGCKTTSARKDVWQPVEAREAVFVHTVTWRSETIAIIAKWYTGNVENGKLLAEANPKTDAKHLEIGDHIFISPDLLITREPLTQGFIADFKEKLKQEKTPVQPKPVPAKKKVVPKKKRKKTKKKVPPKKPAPVDEQTDEEIELFGPK